MRAPMTPFKIGLVIQEARSQASMTRTRLSTDLMMLDRFLGMANRKRVMLPNLNGNATPLRGSLVCPTRMCHSRSRINQTLCLAPGNRAMRARMTPFRIGLVIPEARSQPSMTRTRLSTDRAMLDRSHVMASRRTATLPSLNGNATPLRGSLVCPTRMCHLISRIR